MGTTPTYGLPYPEPTDPADVPTDIHELALAVETPLGALDTRLDSLEAAGILPKPFVRAYRTTPQGIAQATDVAAVYDATRQDSFNMHTPGANGNRLVAVEAGFYIVGGWVQMATTFASYLWLKLRLGGVTSIAEYRSNTFTGGLAVHATIATAYYFAANEWADLSIRHADSQSRNADAVEAFMVKVAG